MTATRRAAGALLDEHSAAHVAELFAAFGDASRLRLFSALIDGERNVGELAAELGLSESAVSHHLRHLRQMRLVQARKAGRQVYYSVTDPHLIALFWQGVRHGRHI